MTTQDNDPWSRPPAYPSAPGGYPSAPQSYPSAPGGYPSAPQSYPSAPGGHPPAPGGHPPASGSYRAPQSYPPPRADAPSRRPRGSEPPQPPTGREQPLRPRKGRGGTVAIIVVGILIVGLVAGLKFGGAARLADLFGGDSSGPTGPRDAWTGTPAADFASGADAVVMPAPVATGQFTAEQVAAALDTVRQALIAGRLDRKGLYDHDTSTFQALLSQYGRDHLDDLISVDKLGPAIFTWIAPGNTLIPDGVRFKGSVTFKDDTLDNGIPVLVVESHYVWAYAFTGEVRRSGDHVVTITDKVDWVFPVPAEVDDNAVGMFVGGAQFSAWGIDCDLMAQDLVALATTPVDVAPSVSVDPDAAFDPDASMDVPEELSC